MARLEQIFSPFGIFFLLASGAVVGWFASRLFGGDRARSQNEELQRRRDELSQIAYVCSHDFKEPLRMIRLYLELLSRHLGQKLDSRGREYLGFAVSGSVKMHELVSALCDYSGATKASPLPKPVDSGRSLEQALFSLEPAIRQVGGEVVSEGSLPQVRIQGRQLTQVFHLLISNAIKFTRKGQKPLVRIRAITRGPRAIFSIRDNGIGLDQEYRKRIFSLFQRLHPAERYPGAGVGLSICKCIVENHGGRIWVRSRAGEGATFYFSLPSSKSQNFLPRPRVPSNYLETRKTAWLTASAR